LSLGQIDARTWARLLAERFFGAEYEGTHVLFYVDRPVLADLAGADEEEAVAALVGAVLPQLRLRSHQELFEPLLKLSARWKLDGGEGAPPCLAALALSVLAANEMRREPGRSAGNYHAWFHELISIGIPDIDQHELWGSYADAYPILWSYLRWWLDERHQGRLGLSTIAEGTRSKLGFADSQTIFASSDRDKISQFLHWVGLTPGEEIVEGELLGYFRIWAARREDLSPGARLMIAEGDLEHGQLGRLIAEAAKRWEGDIRDDEGRIEARLALTLSRPPRSRLGLAAPAPPGFPSRLELIVDGAQIVLEAQDLDHALAADESHWYGELPIEVNAKTLGSGIRLEAEGRVLRLAPRVIYVLHMSRELGCWTSVEQIRPGEPAWLLVGAERLEAITGVLERIARPRWAVLERAGVAPPGWILLRDVIIDRAPEEADDIPAALLPRTSNRLALSGGLPMPRPPHLYLTGGDPDLVLPAQEEGAPALALELDGRPLAPASIQGPASLARLEPLEGDHVLQVGPLVKRYATIRTLGRTAPLVPEPIGHEIHGGPSGWTATSLDATTGADLPEGGARVIGALVERGRGVPGGPEAVQLILPRGALRRVLLSEDPGMLEVVEVPDEPPWMGEAGLNCQCFEHSPRIDAAWLVISWRLRGVTVRRIEPSAEARGAGERDLETWVDAVLGAPVDAAPAGERAAWKQLRLLAEGLR
jgi:hypothetical protein